MGQNYCWGILAHVDAGKTTLSEALLYNAGQLKTQGRVDHGDAFLDTNEEEKDRGITIFSKPACFKYKDKDFTLVDTPGHVDFAIETERAIWALDCAILLINAADGVQSHSKTLFKLLRDYGVPTVIFVNKMDQPGTDEKKLIANIKDKLTDAAGKYDDYEEWASVDEKAMEEFLERDSLSKESMCHLFLEEKFFPIFFGSALKNDGVSQLMDFMADVSFDEELSTNKAFAARVYKIESLSSDSRLTFTKIVSGSIKVKDSLPNGEKIDQIRKYSGSKYEQLQEAKVGDIVALVGPKKTYAGQGLGEELDRKDLQLNPVLQFAVKFNDDTVPKLAFAELKKLNDEDPSLCVSWDEKLEQIKMNLMGQVQTEILIARISKELGFDISFEECGVLYKETIAAPVEGVGHFEPLKHYAEVHLLLEPLEAGAGIVTDCQLSTDDLALNWQRLILSHILEKEHIGTAIGAPITDVKITLIAGKAHIKHTEGGDFREATYRAIRQGLMEAESKILEPYFSFEISVPSTYVGRVMTDIENMSGSFEVPIEENCISTILGRAPAVCIRNYQSKLLSFSKGEGRISLLFDGLRPCHNEEEVLSQRNYNPEADLDNPAGSVFCIHGAASYVPWNEVKANCHLPCIEKRQVIDEEEALSAGIRQMHGSDEWLDPDEIDKILFSATHKNFGKNSKKGWNYTGNNHQRRVDSEYTYTPAKTVKAKEKYLLVDGYNLIHAWPELKEVLDVNLDGARGKLLDILSNYKAMTDYNVIVVFDAYRVKGHAVEASDYQNIHQVFTAEAMTADAYIEKFSHEHAAKYDITVVTSDGLEQLIIRGAGAKLISSREFIKEVAMAAANLREKYNIR